MSEGGAESGQEKSHDATPQKLERARKKGELARSQDLQTFAAYLGLAGAVMLMGTWSLNYLGETLKTFLDRPIELAALFTTAGGATATQIGTRIFAGLAPFFVLPATLIIALLVVQRAIVFAPEKLKPKLSRLSPVANAKQKYGPHGLMEFLKSAIKLIAVTLVLAFALLAELASLPGYVQMEGRLLPLLLNRQFWNIATGVLVLAALVALIDVLWQRHSHKRKMRMTHQELKDENKQSEGDPHMRAQRRDRAREVASNRMLHDVQKADVVIVNPSHYAVALKWSRADNTIPVCVAKGVDELARRIRVRADLAGIPIHSDPPTARSLHALVEVGHPIDPEHYKAVAAAIVFADKMRARQRERAGLGMGE